MHNGSIEQKTNGLLLNSTNADITALPPLHFVKIRRSRMKQTYGPTALDLQYPPLAEVRQWSGRNHTRKGLELTHSLRATSFNKIKSAYWIRRLQDQSNTEPVPRMC